MTKADRKLRDKVRRLAWKVQIAQLQAELRDLKNGTKKKPSIGFAASDNK